jgi:hypothetical protein
MQSISRTSGLPKPKREIQPFGTKNPCSPTVLLFGRDEKTGEGWNHNRAPHTSEFLKMRGVRTVLAPYTPDIRRPNTRVAKRNQFKPVAGYFGPDETKIVGRNGIVSAGVILGNPGEAVMLFTTDPVAVLHFKKTNRTVVMVCNEHTLVDRETVLRGKPTGNPFSVVHSALNGLKPWELRSVQMFITLGRANACVAHPWDDELNGVYNRLFTEYISSRFGSGCFVGEQEEGNLDIMSLVAHQLNKRGLQNVSVHGTDVSGPCWCNDASDQNNQNLVICQL